MEKVNRRLEKIVFLVFTGFFLVVAICHEPWYDEALAWQIARSGTLKDILFSVPHYEGHPPFWYLLLAIPAKLGVPYELGLKTVSGIATLGSVWLLLFRSPFPRVVRCLLPFQYFVFYQYGVIARPYSYMLLSFLLLAICFRGKGEHPVRFTVCLGLICMCSGYGIVLAGGIAAVWLWEICREKGFRVLGRDFLLDRRILCLGGLLVFALIVILSILPRPDAYAMTGDQGGSLLNSLLYTFFIMLPDSIFMTVLQGAEFLKFHTMTPAILLVGIFAGCLLLGGILMAANRKTAPYYFVPYTLFALFSAGVYFCAHHIGIVLLFTIFWLWVVMEGEDGFALGKKVAGLMQKKLQPKEVLLIRRAGMAFGIFLLLVPVYWTAHASIREVREPYYYGRGAAAFLKEHSLDQATVMAPWDSLMENEKPEITDTYERMDTNLVSIPVSILPYFDHNFCRNLNGGREDMAYVTHRVASPEENRENIRQWSGMEYPEVLLGPVDLKAVYGAEAELPDYVPVYKLTPFYANIWKTYGTTNNLLADVSISVREDVLEKYGLKEEK